MEHYKTSLEITTQKANTYFDGEKSKIKIRKNVEDDKTQLLL